MNKTYCFLLMLLLLSGCSNCSCVEWKIRNVQIDGDGGSTDMHSTITQEYSITSTFVTIWF